MTVAARPPDTAQLLALAIADPDAAEWWSSRLLGSEHDAGTLSVAHQALGIVWRDRGRTTDAVASMRRAVRLAARSGNPDREADARATLGATLLVDGRTEAGLGQLDTAIDTAVDPVVRAKALVRRGHVQHFVLSRPHDALADLQEALVCLREVDEPVWLARTLNLLGLSHMAVGEAGPAAQAVEEAGSIFEREGQVAESVVTLHNLGMIAFSCGDLPRAMELYDGAAEHYAAAGVENALLVIDQAEALLAAGLAAEAVELVQARLTGGSLVASQEAELVLWLASAELAVQDTVGARASATRARTMFRRQHRDYWSMRAELTLVLARHQGGEAGRRLVQSAASVAAGLQSAGADEAALAWLVAGQVAQRARHPEAAELLGFAAAYRAHSADLVRATAWHAEALRHAASGRRRSVLSSCRRGLDALDDHRESLGSTELRALATRHGDEVAALALVHAARGGSRTLLEWSERWRATTLSQPPIRPPDDAELARDLTALRDTRRRLTEARAEGAPTLARLDDERVRLERAIRRRSHHLRGVSARAERFDADRLVDALDGATFVELVDVDGMLHALVAAAGRVRRLEVGATHEAEQAVAFARFTLRQAARGRPSDLDGVGRRLQATLLGDAARRLDGGPVVVSPPGRLLAVPWALAPALADVPVTVSPSAALWLRARSSSSTGGRRVLISGPGLESGGAELDTLRQRHPDAVLLRDGAATVERALAALDGASVAHVAAHGKFREDSPLFSSLELDDGSLTVHDLERLERAPHRMVLSACESGVVAPIGAGEMLGLVAAMLAMGSAGVVSSVAQVNDHATSELMLDLHAALDDGEGLGSALLRARQAARGDRVREATAAAFSGMGT